MLFIKTQKPFSWVITWTEDTLLEAGIDMNCFSAHSTMSASCSAAKKANVPIDTILKTAGWKQFYNRPVSNDDSFSRSILNSLT